MRSVIRPRRTRGPGHDERGFSLIEVLFALVFLGIGLMAVAQMIPLATRQIVSSKAMSAGVAAGSAKMEELKTSAYSSAVLTAGTHADTTGKYARSWTVTDNTPVTGSKRIDMIVTWSSFKGTQQARMTTYMTR